MTHRRCLLKAALAAPAAALAPHLPVSAAPLGLVPAAPGGDVSLFDLYADWLTYDAEMGTTFPALELAERGASARGVNWDNCPAVRAVLARQEAFWGAQQRALYEVAATPAACLDGIAVKLALWRRANPDVRHGQFTDGWDRLAFSAYDDMIAMTDRQDLTHPEDETLRIENKRMAGEG